MNADMEQEKMKFKPISLRPHWLQFTINQLHWLILCLVIFIIYFYTPDLRLKYGFLCVGLILLMYILYQAAYIARIEYIVTNDQIVYLHGVVRHSTDYLELYRVVDYQQYSSLMQQIMGLKTVVIYSEDRNTPVMIITGIKQRLNVIQEIRKRVEYNKSLKRIYEISNKM